MVDVQTVSIAIASAGAVAGIVYYAFQVRHQTKLRESEVILKLSSMFSEERFMKAYERVFDCEFEDYNDFLRKHGSLFYDKSEPELKDSLVQVLNQIETLGLLLKRKVVDADLMYEIYPGIRLWEKLKPLVEGARKELNSPGLWSCFEYYYNEMKKREQRGVK